jgi:hypothetical protein
MLLFLHLARRKEIYEEMYPETKQGGDRGKNQYTEWKEPKGNNYPLPPSFVEDTAKKVNISESTIKQELQISSNLTPEMKVHVLGEIALNQQ